MRKSISAPSSLNASLATTTSVVVDLDNVEAISVQINYSDDAPAVKTFVDGDVDTDEDTVTISSHPYVTGTKVALTTDGTLPTGLSATNYWVIKVDASTIKLASSLANAEAGTAVNITAAAGGGTHTLTAATSSGNVCKLQSSNDNSNWTDVSGKTVTIATSSGTAQWDIDRPAYRYLKILYTPSAGQVALEAIISQSL